MAVCRWRSYSSEQIMYNVCILRAASQPSGKEFITRLLRSEIFSLMLLWSSVKESSVDFFLDFPSIRTRA